MAGRRTLLAAGGRPGTAMVTLVYVLVGITAQFLLGLGLAYLLTQGLPGQRFFRVVFLLPMMITPVGVAYMFRMLTDTGKGPLQPLWAAVGLSDFSWVNDPWGARVAVMVGDIWQWTPFMFIILLAALEAQDTDTVEAGMVDGANRWQIFRHISLPAILPVCATVVLIRLIEAFKIIDLPNILTNGGPARPPSRSACTPTSAGGPWTSASRRRSPTRCCSSSPWPRWPTSTWSGGGSRRSEPMSPLRRRSVKDLPPAGKLAAYLILGRLGRRGPVPAVLAGDHLVQAARPGQQRARVPAVRRLPAVPRRLALHLRGPQGDTLRPYVNTVVVALSSSVLALVLGSAGAYALARFPYKPRLG